MVREVSGYRGMGNWGIFQVESECRFLGAARHRVEVFIYIYMIPTKNIKLSTYSI